MKELVNSILNAAQGRKDESYMRIIKTQTDVDNLQETWFSYHRSCLKNYTSKRNIKFSHMEENIDEFILDTKFNIFFDHNHQNHYIGIHVWIQKAQWRQDTSCNLWIRFGSWLQIIMPFPKGELSSSCLLSVHLLYVSFCFPYKHPPEINIHWHLHDMKWGRQSQLL